jgi:SNF2 family DNA or RNA helicase
MLASEVAERMFGKQEERNRELDLHQCQIDSIAKLIKPENRRHILGLPMGTGKTYIGCRTLAHYNPRRSLLIATDRAILSWLRHMWIWFPDQLNKYILLTGGYKKEIRHAFLQKNAKHPDLSIITNFQLAVRDRESYPLNWDSVTVDEYHKFMRNRDTGLHKFLGKLREDNLLLVSGSPSTKGFIDYFVPFNLIDRKLFSSYWRFGKTWCHEDISPHGKSFYGSRNEEQFRKLLAQYAIVATKKELGLQKKIRDILPVEMTGPQRRAYEQVRDEFLLELEDGSTEIMLNTLSQYTKMRKLLSCPAQIAPELGIGGAAVEVGEMLMDLPRDERHSVIFTPYRDAVPILKAYFEANATHYGLSDPGVDLQTPVFTLMGGLKLEVLYETIQKFKAQKGLIVCTTDYAESFDLDSADKCFHIGYSWDPQVNFQAEDRLDRLSNPHGLINSYYMQCSNTLDEQIMYGLVHKQANVNKMYSNKANLIAALRSN